MLLRCLRAALCVSHGVRRDARIYLVLHGGPQAPRALRFDGATAKFLRPDERSLALLVQKSLAVAPRVGDAGFREVRPGIALAEGGLALVLEDLGACTPVVLDEGGADVRADPLAEEDLAYFVGDDQGFDEPTREALAARGARRVSVGPTSLHAEDAITVLSNELDRRAPSD